MNAQFDRHLNIAGAYNIRDLGGYPAGSNQTQWRRVLRADALHRLDQAGVEALIEAGVRTVIDLRHEGELAQAPNPLSRDERVHYINVSLFENLAPQAMVADAKTPVDMLLNLYLDALAQRQEAIRQVLTHIAQAGEGAVMFHCTAGKDRTGVIAALLLSVAGVDAETIRGDYALTKAAIAPMIEELVAGAKARGADVDGFMPLLACEPATMQAMLDHLEAQYGGAAAYLAGIGLDAALVARLRDRLITAEAKEASNGTA